MYSNHRVNICTSVLQLLFYLTKIQQMIVINCWGKEWTCRNRIQNFPWSAIPRGWGLNLLFGKIFAENCMKMTKNWTDSVARP